MMEKSDNPSGPLVGYRVLELGSTVAGPFCGRLLADFGADVIKVEPAEGDPVRSMGKHYRGKSLYAASILRNKRLVGIDLRTPEGQNLIRRLVTSCDILVENFRPGTLEEWGLGYDDLSRLNPGLVMVRISGYGQSGPNRLRPGYGAIAEAVSGLRHVTGDPDRPPARTAVSLGDCVTGLYGAYAAVMALLNRARTGRGQLIDAALYECAFSLMEPHVPAYEKLGFIPARAGARLAGTAPNNLYPTADGSYIHITAANEGTFRRLAKAMGRPELMADARFVTALSRSRHVDELDQIVSEWTCTQTLSALEQALIEASVPATRCFTMEDIFRDPHYSARDMLAQVPDDELGTVTLAAVVPKMSGSPGAIRRSGGVVGRDTREVLRQVAHLSDQEIEQLEAAGVILCAAARTINAEEPNSNESQTE
jgi:crotonobetainyl-CoA:carnitine CoA-transferase CaiB-like acyl-CoA transferase